MRLSFLFWNLQKKPLQEKISRIVWGESIDFIALAENEISEADLKNKIQEVSGFLFEKSQAVIEEKRKVDLFLRSGFSRSYEQFPDNRMTIYRIAPDNSLPFLLCVVHFPDPINHDIQTRNELMNEYSQRVRQSQSDTGIDRIIVVGDFNLNPFDRGMYSSRGFHSMMTKDVAQRQERTTAGVTSSFFYNPMWGCFGDRTDGPPGTVYYAQGVATTFWNIYDQVLLSPSLMHSLQELRILDSDGMDSLLNENGTPDIRTASDHLPIKFVLDI